MAKFKEPAQLHNHSKYSLLDAVPSPEEWVGWCLETGTPALAVTDHGTAISMLDALKSKEFIAKYNKENKTNHPLDAVSLIPAVELYVKLNAEDKSHYHITTWAASTEGYFNLMKLASIAYNDTVSYFGSVKARVNFEQIKQYKKGIKFGTGCIVGPIGQAIMKDQDVKLAEERFLMYKELFGDDLYIEFHIGDVTHNFNKKTGGFDPFMPTQGKDECVCDVNKQRGYNQFLMRMIDKHGGKCIPVTDAHFIAPEDKIIQDCLLKNGNSNGWYFHESYHQVRADEMFKKLQVHLGEEWMTEKRFEEWIDNTHEVMNAAKTIDVKFDYHLPKIEIPEILKYKNPDYNKQVYLLMMDKIKTHGRWNDSPEYIKRFRQEIDVVCKNEKLDFLPYFMMYEDICQFCRDQGFLTNIGRGSAGGSLLSYYLKIIHVDPMEKGIELPFERFLSHARIRAGSFPDIDLDIPDRARPFVMKYLKEKYKLGFAQIATFSKMKTKNAIKDAMFAIYGQNGNDPNVRIVTDTIPDSPQGVDEHDFLYGYTDKEGNYNHGQVEINKQLANFFTARPEVEKMVGKLIGTIRGWSRHASAFVISTVDLSASRVPTMIIEDKEAGEIQVTQYDAGMVEQCGLVKADILGIKTLSAVSDCVDLVKSTYNIDLLDEGDKGRALIYRLPEDPAIYKDFYNKDTDSSFQFNTDVVKGSVTDFHPMQRSHLSIMTALLRPGATDAKIKFNDVNKRLYAHSHPENKEEALDITADRFYIGVRKGDLEPQYIHQDLEPILKDTYGVIVYQEQVMEVLVKLCGYTLEETDIIRSAIAKKKHEVMMSTFDRIRQVTQANGWTKEQADDLCQTIMAFSRYSFNKAHSHSYAELGYITMYLKHHYGMEWWASMLNCEDNAEKVRRYVSVLGNKIKPPSLAHPTNRYEVKQDYGTKFIVTPISALKGVGPAVVAELTSKGPFVSLEDYVLRVNHSKVNTGYMASIIRGRAADDLMDLDIIEESYGQARLDFMAKYLKLRGGKCALQEDLFTVDPLTVFVMEKETNQAFNKSMLDDTGIQDVLKAKWPGLRATGNSAVPFYMGDFKVLANVKVAEGIMKKGYEEDFGMFLLYEKSEFKRGISKKGKAWTRVSVKLSDGYTTLECTDWDRKSALGWAKNSLVYVRGQLRPGFKTAVQMTISEIVQVE
jgi:DNA polymerase-3 subunit alpha